MTYYKAAIIQPSAKSTQKTTIKVETVMVMMSKGEDIKNVRMSKCEAPCSTGKMGKYGRHVFLPYQPVT